MTRTQILELKRRIKRLIDAEVADSWKGGGDPDDWPEIEKELRAARKSLNQFLSAHNHG